jgi:hypothetical protein
MLETLTAKLKLEVTPEQKEQLRVTSLAYRDALNYTSSVTLEELNKATTEPRFRRRFITRFEKGLS